MSQDSNPLLYGITSVNSSRQGSELWGKNQFNSTFPLALCLYMHKLDIKPVTVQYSNEKNFIANDEVWSMEEVIGDQGQKPSYCFEAQFDPYVKYSRNIADTIDLVVNLDNDPHLPLEVKLTVVPDSSTSKLDELKWAPELVVRPVSSAYAMMGVAKSIFENPNIKKAVISNLKEGYNRISRWDSEAEILQNMEILQNCLKLTLGIVAPFQKPFLVQPIWRTKGQSFELSEQCLDVFVWSDVAIMMLVADQSAINRKITRRTREVVRHVKALYDLLTQGDYDYAEIYKGMSLGHQTDKAFSISGQTTQKYLEHERLRNPVLKSFELHKIVLNGGHLELQPERRFDAAVRDFMIQGKKMQ